MHSKKTALEMMRDMDSESYMSQIVVSSPSGASNTSSSSATTPTHVHQKLTVSNSHNSTLANPLRKGGNPTTPTKKMTKHKSRAQSSSALTNSTVKLGSTPPSSSSGTTSPSHRISDMGGPSSSSSTRPRGMSHGSGSKSQVLTPPGVTFSSASQRGSNESVGSGSSREKKVVSPNRTSRTNV